MRWEEDEKNKGVGGWSKSEMRRKNKKEGSWRRGITRRGARHPEELCSMTSTTSVLVSCLSLCFNSFIVRLG